MLTLADDACAWFEQTVRKRPLVGCPEHDIICEDCFGSYLSGKIASEEVVPYIRCPAEDCKVNCAAARAIFI